MSDRNKGTESKGTEEEKIADKEKGGQEEKSRKQTESERLQIKLSELSVSDKQSRGALELCKQILRSAYDSAEFEPTKAIVEGAGLIKLEEQYGQLGAAICEDAVKIVGQLLSEVQALKKALNENASMKKDHKQFTEEGIRIRGEVVGLNRRIAELEESLVQRKEKCDKLRKTKSENWSKIRELENKGVEFDKMKRRCERAEKEAADYKHGDELMKESVADLQARLDRTTKAAHASAKQVMTLDLKLKKADKQITALSTTAPEAEKPVAKEKTTKKKTPAKKPAKKKESETDGKTTK